MDKQVLRKRMREKQKQLRRRKMMGPVCGRSGSGHCISGKRSDPSDYP